MLYTPVSDLSLPDALERLSQGDEPGWFNIDLGGFTTTIWFARPQRDYSCLVLEVDKYAFLEIEGDPARVEIFSSTWARFCEAVQASAAVFSRELGYDRPQSIEQRLTTLFKHDMARFVTNVDWRTYLELELGRLWREQEPMPERYYQRVEELPSGATQARDITPKSGIGTRCITFVFLSGSLSSIRRWQDASACWRHCIRNKSVCCVSRTTGAIAGMESRRIMTIKVWTSPARSSTRCALPGPARCSAQDLWGYNRRLQVNQDRMRSLFRWSPLRVVSGSSLHCSSRLICTHQPGTIRKKDYRHESSGSCRPRNCIQWTASHHTCGSTSGVASRLRWTRH